MKSLFSLFNYIIKPFQVQKQEFELPQVESLSLGSDKTVFYLNDPTTPQLMGEQAPPVDTSFPVNVKGDKGPGFPLGSAEQQASACKLIVNNLLSYLLVLYKFTNSDRKLNNWVLKRPLSIVPRAGADLNAYYDRSSLKFFYYKSLEKVVYSCDSTPVVCHEFGHAFLDTMRPDFWSAQAFEVWAYHESFGDIASIISSLQNEDLINYAMKETNGNLLKSNVVTRIGAEMGKTYYETLKDKNGMSPSCLRDASVVYNYVLPETLPKKGRDDVLLYESHNFSRVFTGAFYELLVKVAQQIVKDGTCKDMMQAMKLSRDVCSRYLLKATISVPLTIRLFEALAKQIILADKAEGSKYESVIKNVFSSRGILRNKILMLKDKNIKDIRKELVNDSYVIDVFGSSRAIRTMSNKRIKVIDKRILGLKNNHLYGLEVEVATQSSYLFDQEGNLVDFVGSTEDEVVSEAIECLDYLDSNNLIGSSKDALFEIKEGLIKRKQIMCKCGLPNYCDPNAPEFNKPWKPANHSSCCKCTGPGCAPRSCDCTSSTPTNSKKKSYCSSVVSYCNKGKYFVGQYLKRKVCSN